MHLGRKSELLAAYTRFAPLPPQVMATQHNATRTSVHVLAVQGTTGSWVGARHASSAALSASRKESARHVEAASF